MYYIILTIVGIILTALSVKSSLNYVNGKYDCKPGSMTCPLIGACGMFIGVATAIGYGVKIIGA